jgi:hypothetical protein
MQYTRISWEIGWLRPFPSLSTAGFCTDKKENQIFLINKEIQSGAVAKSYMHEEGLPYI